MLAILPKSSNFRLCEKSGLIYKQGQIGSDEVDVGESRPQTFTLEANYPNPFNPVTTIPFTMADAGQVRIEIYDLIGRRVAVLTDRMYEAGRHNVRWDGSSAASGVYLIRMLVMTRENNAPMLFHRSMTLVK